MDEQQRAAEVRRVMAGDADALQHLIVDYHLPLRRLLENRIEPDLQHRLDPDDVLQQAYVTAFKSVGDCHFDRPAGFYKWLEANVLSRLKDQQRALRRHKRDLAREVRTGADWSPSRPNLIERLAASESTPGRHVAKEEAVAAVLSCLARLTDEQRQVVRLRFLEGRSVAEVAAKLGKTEPAIHMLCHRGLKALRQRMVSITRYLTRL